MQLPGELERFWRLVDPRTVRASVFPEFSMPESALEHWRRIRNEFPYWLDRIHKLMAGDSVEERIDNSQHSYVRVIDPLDELPLAAPRDVPPHLLYGTQIEIRRDTLSWPAHWQRASGIDPHDAEPRGAIRTVGDVLASDPAVELRATVAGRVVDLAGSSARVRVRVSDGTGTIDVDCAPETTPFGRACGDTFEFDITVPAGERRVPADPDAAGDSTDDPVEHVSRVLLARYGAPPARSRPPCDHSDNPSSSSPAGAAPL